MGTNRRADDVRALRTSVESALREDSRPVEVVALLRRLACIARPGSEDFGFAHRHLAQLTVESEPWRAALSAREAARSDPADDRAWALYGLCLSVLGHYRAAAWAYRRALALCPDNPWYAHNLGHLLDVALGRPVEALPLLAAAVRRQPCEIEIAASYAHALGRAGRVDQARRVLRRHMADARADTEHKALMHWLERGAPDTPRAVQGRTRRRVRDHAPQRSDRKRSRTTHPQH